MEKKRVIILGAGAAKIYGGPSSADLLAKTINIPEVKHIKRLFEKNNINPNFEDIIAVIEMEYMFLNNKFGKDALPLLFKFKKKVGLKYIHHSYLRILDIICSEIISGIENPETSYDEDFVRYITSFEGQNKIYSLNYDRRPKDILSHCWKVYEGVDGKGQFEYDLQKFIKSNISFWNLHGSVYLRGNNFSLGKIFLENAPRKILGYSKFDSDCRYFIPIITGHNKPRQILSNPFLFGYDALAVDLNTATRIDIIGYSFSDNHINASLKFLTKKNPMKAINIIGFCSNPDKYDEREHNTELEKEYYSWPFMNDYSSQLKLERNGVYNDSENNIKFWSKGFESYLKSL